MAKFAAVDIGSNSMRLLVAEIDSRGQLVRLAEDRQVTRLGESVFTRGILSEDAIFVAEQVLTRFRGVVQGLGVESIRAVATSATRDASNREDFLARAHNALGAPIEIISGVEEARLIGLGVHAVWPQGDDPVLIIDVGGGSAEFVLMDSGTMLEGYSRPLGAVRLNEVFLDKDLPKREQVLRLQKFIDEKLELVVRRLGGQSFVRGIATSASAAAIVCAVNGIPRSARNLAEQRTATLEQVRRFYRELLAMPIEQRRKLPGIGPRRAEIIVAGAAVFLRAMERFDLPVLHYCGAGVREGIVADLATRGEISSRSGLQESERRVVETFAKRYGISLAHAKVTASFALELFERLRPLHKLDAGYARLLEAACHLLDVGHFVSDTGHHKHSHYLVSHADLPGFTENEKRLIALLCRFHRKSMPSNRYPEFVALPAADRRALELLVPFVRTADALDRSRDQHVRLARCQIRGDEVALTLEAEEGKDYALEEWAVERSGAAFRSVYNKNLVVAKI